MEKPNYSSDMSFKDISKLCVKTQKPVQINSDIIFYIGKKPVRGKTKSSLVKSKDSYDENSYIDVIANGKTYLCKFDHKKNKYFVMN